MVHRAKRSAQEVQSSIDTACSNNWTLGISSGRCYFFVSNTGALKPRSLNDSLKSCENLTKNSQLLTLLDLKELGFILKILSPRLNPVANAVGFLNGHIIQSQVNNGQYQLGIPLKIKQIFINLFSATSYFATSSCWPQR